MTVIKKHKLKKKIKAIFRNTNGPGHLIEIGDQGSLHTGHNLCKSCSQMTPIQYFVFGGVYFYVLLNCICLKLKLYFSETQRPGHLIKIGNQGSLHTGDAIFANLSPR